MSSQFPVLVAGQKITADLLASGQPRMAYKTGDTSRTSTTPTNDPDLAITVAANAIYQLSGLLVLDATDQTTDINVDWDGPAGTTGSWLGTAGPTSLTSETTTIRTVITGALSARTYGVNNGGASNPTSLLINGLVITSSTAGTYTLVWGAASSSGTVSVKANSFIVLQRYV